MNHTDASGELLVAPTLEFARYVGGRIGRLAQTGTQDSPEALDARFSGACDDIIMTLRHVLDSVADYRLTSQTTQRYTYLLAAWADEYLMRALGARVPATSVGRIEASLFSTREAGERVFVMLDELLAEQSEATRVLAPAALWVLALGFTGQYGNADDARLRHYRTALAAWAPRVAVDAPGAGPVPWAPPQPDSLRPVLLTAALAAGLWLAALVACNYAFVHEMAPVEAALQPHGVSARLDADAP